MTKNIKTLSAGIFRAKIFLKLGLLLVFTNCGELPPVWEVCSSQSSSSSPGSQAINISNNELVIYLDTSLSMAGFISPNGTSRFSVAPDGQTIFSKTLLELRNVVNTLSPELTTLVRHVDKTELPRTPDENMGGLVYAATRRSLYNGTETNLVGAVKSFSLPHQENQEPTEPSRFHLLVTDGVQSTENNQGRNCLNGSDASCVKAEIQKLLKNKWFGVVLALRSEFDGYVYSENAPPWLAPEKRRNHYASGNQDNEKFRPFYLYVFSLDKAGLDKLVEKIKENLRVRIDKIVIREYGLTTDYTKGYATVSNLDLSEGAKDYLTIKNETLKTGTLPQFTVSVDSQTSQLDASNTPDKTFRLLIKPDWSNHAHDSNLVDIIQNLKWQVVNCLEETEISDNRYPSLRVVTENIKILNDGSIDLPLEASWLPNEAGPKKWRSFWLIGRIDTEKPFPPWVKEWSTEDDQQIETANKTLNLSISLANLWQNDAIQNQNIVEVCLRVGE